MLHGFSKSVFFLLFIDNCTDTCTCTSWKCKNQFRFIIKVYSNSKSNVTAGLLASAALFVHFFTTQFEMIKKIHCLISVYIFSDQGCT